MTRLLTTAAFAALVIAGAASAQSSQAPHRYPDGNYGSDDITVDQASENGELTYDEFKFSRFFDRYNTIPFKQGDQAEWLEFTEFRRVLEDDLRSADRNGNGRIDTETERCLFHRTGDGRMAGGLGFSAADIDEATIRRQKWFASLRSWNGPTDKTFSGEWPTATKEHYPLAGADQKLQWAEIAGCAFMAEAGAEPGAPVTPTPVVPPAPVTPVTPGVPVTPVQPAAPCTVPSQADAIRIVFEAWADGRLTRAEADTLNRGRFCQLDADTNGGMTEAEFVALSLADFDRADRNGDGVLSGRREIGALANPGSPVAAGFTRQQAQDLAKLRFAVLDRQPRDGQVTLEEYLAVTGEEFARNDVNGDGALTGAEAARQPAAQ